MTLTAAAGLTLLLLTLGYALVCYARPFGTCRHSLGARPRRTCRRCNGTGLRVRTGVHLFNQLRRPTRNR